jgi:hypothetical integral membrane protein (TIGR02206 family)
MANIDCLQNFHAGSIINLLMLCIVMGMISALVVRGNHRTDFPARPRPNTDKRVATILYCVWLTAFFRDLRPDRLGWAHSLPLHICDITGLLAAFAIQTRNRLARCILHFWGLTLSSIAFLFPVLRAGPIHSDFWIYWMDHSAIVLAATYDVTRRNFRPDWADWRRAVLGLAIYAMLIAPLDRLLGVDYGYLGQTDHPQRAIVEAFGPWPDRVATLWLTAVAAMTLLKLASQSSRNSKLPVQHERNIRSV